MDSVPFFYGGIFRLLVGEFRYEERERKTRIRRVPARSNRPAGYGIVAWFDCISEGDTLSDGGTVETTYNERDQPGEARILDDQGMFLRTGVVRSPHSQHKFCGLS